MPNSTTDRRSFIKTSAGLAAGTLLLPSISRAQGANDRVTVGMVGVGGRGRFLIDRLCERGGAHFGSPDKRPAARLETIRLAGEARVPLTSGILIGIGETRDERIDALLALRDLHRRHGHIQEIIVQNFRAKPGTAMAAAPEPVLDDLAWTIAATRLIFGATANIQAPPNLSADDYPRLLDAGLNDWGGVAQLVRAAAS